MIECQVESCYYNKYGTCSLKNICISEYGKCQTFENFHGKEMPDEQSRI
jgi:hypothetical protein